MNRHEITELELRAIELHLKPDTDLLKKYGKTLRELSRFKRASYSECRGHSDRRFVTLKFEGEETLELADKLLREFGRTSYKNPERPVTTVIFRMNNPRASDLVMYAHPDEGIGRVWSRCCAYIAKEAPRVLAGERKRKADGLRATRRQYRRDLERVRAIRAASSEAEAVEALRANRGLTL